MLPKTAWPDAFGVEKLQISEIAATAASADLFMNFLPGIADQPTKQGNAGTVVCKS